MLFENTFHLGVPVKTFHVKKIDFNKYLNTYAAQIYRLFESNNQFLHYIYRINIYLNGIKYSAFTAQWNTSFKLIC